VSVAILVIRLLLATVFLAAGAAKLLDRRGSKTALEAFGVPRLAAQPLSFALPAAELAVGIALVPNTTAWPAAIAAAALLVVFMLGIGFNIARGQTPDCHCFGQLHSAPAGWATLIRNALLAAAALLIVARNQAGVGDSVAGLIGKTTTTERLTTAVGVLFAMLVANSFVLLRVACRAGSRPGPGLRDRDTPARGSAPMPAGLVPGLKAPEFRLTGPSNEVVTLGDLRTNGVPVLLIFTDPTCVSCTALLPEIATWQRERGSTLTIAVVSRGTRETAHNAVEDHGIRHLLFDPERQTAAAYRIEWTPTAVLVNAHGQIASNLAAGPDSIRALVGNELRRALHRHSPGGPEDGTNGHREGFVQSVPLTARIGDPLPEFALPDLDGAQVSRSSLLGSHTVLLFWNPTCGFCREMLDDLRTWETKPTQKTPRLLIVSTGSPDQLRKDGLRSTVLLDHSLTLGQAVGARGTPMAVLVDPDGAIASEIAVGAGAVLALANQPLA